MNFEKNTTFESQYDNDYGYTLLDERTQFVDTIKEYAKQVLGQIRTVWKPTLGFGQKIPGINKLTFSAC